MNYYRLGAPVFGNDSDVDKRSHFRMKSGAFSLVELLVVMSVIVVLLSLLAPAFVGVGKGSSLKASGNNVSNLAMVARQNSLAKNAMTALVVIAGSGTTADYHAVGLFEIVPRADGTLPASLDWTQLGKWETLPDAITIDSCTLDAQSVTSTPALPPLYYQGSQVTQYQYVVFVSNGSLLTTTVSQIRLVPGYRSAPQSVVYTETLIGGTPSNYYAITLLNSNGHVKIEQP